MPMYSRTSDVGIGDDHILTAQYIGRTQQHRITQLVSSLDCFLSGKYGGTLGTRDTALLQHLIEALPVLGGIDAVCRSTQDIHALAPADAW